MAGAISRSLLEYFSDYNYTVVGQGSEDLADVIIEDVTSDSRLVQAGSLFIAKKGGALDGHSFLSQVVEKECAAIVVQQGSYDPSLFTGLTIPVVEVEDTVRFYGDSVAFYYGNPAEKLRLIGVTGTNGKTTVTYLLEEMLSSLGYGVGVIGTVNNRYRDSKGEQHVFPTALTTPDGKIIQKLLAEMVDGGVSDVVMEVSSHAISQARIYPLRYDIAIFTNLSRDHLDYHGDMDEYFAVKEKLFTTYLKQDGVAVLPADERSLSLPYQKQFASLLKESGVATVLWGEGSNANIQLVSHQAMLHGTSCDVALDAGNLSFKTKMVGRFNIDNLLCLLGTAKALGLDFEKVETLLPEIQGAPGRLQRIVDSETSNEDQPVVFVDYAHTPDALEKLLSTLADLPHGRIISVFGCGGDRDRGKRPLMGGIGARLSDIAIITEDNPRTEESSQIFADIVQGVQEAGVDIYDSLDELVQKGKGAVLIRSRRQAIEEAVRLATSSDIVVIAGKGHEPYQLGKDGKVFFDDSLEALSVLGSWTLEKLVHATGGVLSSGSDETGLLGQVITDSRKVGRGDIFVALRGENCDGHDYLKGAAAQGAGCLIIEKHQPQLSCPQIIVSDTLVALGDLAHAKVRSSVKGKNLPVVGITGSSGKTTIKEMTASIARSVWPAGPDFAENAVVKTEGNFNNLIGLPLSIFPMDVHNKIAIFEMGMNCPGEISRLSEIAEPDIVCIGNVHGAHLAGLGTIEGVAKAKEEIFAGAGKDTVLVINLDDPFVREMSTRYTQKQIRFSLDAKNVDKADLWASDITTSSDGKIGFVLHIGETKQKVGLQTYGLHNVANALAAASLATAFGADIEQLVHGLEGYRTPAKRMEISTTHQGWRLVCDCYNANPASMAAGLKALVTMGAGRKGAILGDMFELGEGATSAHYEVGKLAGELQLDFLAVVGDFANHVEQGALEAGLDSEKVFSFSTKEALGEWMERLNVQLESDTYVLVKASRGMALETLIEPYITSGN